MGNLAPMLLLNERPLRRVESGNLLIEPNIISPCNLRAQLTQLGWSPVLSLRNSVLAEPYPWLYYRKLET